MKGTSGPRRVLAVLVLSAFLPLATTGCFGNFELTQKLWRWNKRVDPDKWIREVVFLVITIIPIFPGAVILDAIVFNSIEFWTGSNPVLAEIGAQKVVLGPNGERLTFTRAGPHTVDVRVESDRAIHEFQLVRDDAGVSALDPDGRLIARAVSVNGIPTLVAGAE